MTAKWIFKTKFDSAGLPSKLKARLVVRGYLHQEGINYNEVFAPVAKWNTVRVIIAMAVARHWPLFHLHVKIAFLNGNLRETVWMTIREGFVTPETRHLTCQPLKSLYGLKQALRAWFENIDDFFRSCGLHRTKANYSLYYLLEEGGVVILYVDDLILIGNNATKIRWLKNHLISKFEMTDLGNLKFYLRVEFQRTSKGLLLNQ